MFPKSVSGTSLNILKNKAQHMLAEFIIVAAQSCQNGQCPTAEKSSVVATTVTVINGPPAWLAFYGHKQKTYGREYARRLLRPVKTCCGGKCK
jgi:hypothetical protein